MVAESGKRSPTAAGATVSKVFTWTTRRTGTEHLRGSQATSIMETTSAMSARAMEKCTGQMAASTVESGAKASSMVEA